VTCKVGRVVLDHKGEPADAGSAVPPLTEKELEEAQQRTKVTPPVVHETVRRDGEEELRRPVQALAWSGLAAGLSMGFSFLTQALFREHLPDEPWRMLITSLGYPVGFLIVIIGRQQLFTENTLTAIIPLLARRNSRTLRAVLKLWAVVLAANMIGAHLFAWTVAQTGVVREPLREALRHVAIEAADVTFGNAILRGVFAGWLIAMVVWMLAASDSGRLGITVILTYVVGLAGLTHIVAGSVEVLFLVMIGEKTWWGFCTGYMLPTLLGNILGGVALVSALNHAQVIAGHSNGQIRA
jgi:formate-nitrite transporter family protein